MLAVLVQACGIPKGGPSQSAAHPHAVRTSIRDAATFLEEELAEVRALHGRLSELADQWHTVLNRHPRWDFPDSSEARSLLSELGAFAHELAGHGARIDAIEGVARCVERCAGCAADVCLATEWACEMVNTMRFDAQIVDDYVTALRKAFPRDIRAADVAAVMTSLVWSKSETPRQRKRRR
jgi:hypothetical protein